MSLVFDFSRWKKCTILDLLVQPITDGPHETPKLVEDGVPFLSVESIHDGIVDISKKRGNISPEYDTQCCKKYKPQKDDIFVVKSASVGRVAMVGEDTNFNIWSPIAALRVNDNNDPRFVFHLLQTQWIQSEMKKRSSVGSQPNLSMRVLESFEVIVPPLEEQKIIASILDTFTALTAELTAELTARKEQYEFYRDKLLSFDHLTPEEREKLGVRWMTIKDLSISICSGGTPLKSKSSYYGGDIPWLRTQEVTFNEIYSTECHISEEGLNNSSAKWIPENCVIVAISGATAARCAINKIALTTNQHCCNIQVNPDVALYRYVFHWISSHYLDLKSEGRGAREDITSQIIANYPICIPSLDEQKRIVDVLDCFNSLCSDLSNGIPAEIEARKKQYEYYRDKLLSFDKVSS